MPSYLTSDTLIASVKRKEGIPTSQVTFQPNDFLAFANDEMMSALVPQILSFHEEFFVVTERIPITQNRFTYAIPTRAIGNRVRSVQWVDASGNMNPMTRILEENIGDARSRGNAVRGFYFQGTDIVLLDTWASSALGQIAVSYYMRPNQLVTTDRVAVIAGIDRTTGNIALQTTPLVFAPTALYDFLEVAGAHKTRGYDLPCNTVSTITNTINFDPATIPLDLLPGDHLALSGECMIPQIPDDIHNVLAQRTAARCLEALGDTQGLQAANTKLTELEVRVGNLLDNRSDGNPIKVTNVGGLLRRGKPVRWST